MNLLNIVKERGKKFVPVRGPYTVDQDLPIDKFDELGNEIPPLLELEGIPPLISRKEWTWSTFVKETVDDRVAIAQFELRMALRAQEREQRRKAQQQWEEVSV